jgi:hypothetical protein
MWTSELEQSVLNMQKKTDLRTFVFLGGNSSNCQMLSPIGTFGHSVLGWWWDAESHHTNSGFGDTSSIPATFFLGNFRVL